jgi:hypothetical protein
MDSTDASFLFRTPRATRPAAPAATPPATGLPLSTPSVPPVPICTAAFTGTGTAVTVRSTATTGTTTIGTICTTGTAGTFASSRLRVLQHRLGHATLTIQPPLLAGTVATFGTTGPSGNTGAIANIGTAANNGHHCHHRHHCKHRHHCPRQHYCSMGRHLLALPAPLAPLGPAIPTASPPAHPIDAPTDTPAVTPTAVPSSTPGFDMLCLRHPFGFDTPVVSTPHNGLDRCVVSIPHASGYSSCCPCDYSHSDWIGITTPSDATGTITGTTTAGTTTAGTGTTSGTTTAGYVLPHPWVAPM